MQWRYDANAVRNVKLKQLFSDLVCMLIAHFFWLSVDVISTH